MSGVKAMPTLGVLSVYTGICLGEFGDIHEVMDHFYPEIMTIGVARMQNTASREVLRQVPTVADIPVPDDWSTGYAEYALAAVTKFGSTMDLTGPHGTGAPDMEQM